METGCLRTAAAASASISPRYEVLRSNRLYGFRMEKLGMGLGQDRQYPRKNYILNTVDGAFAATGQGMVGVNILLLFISEYIGKKSLDGLLITVYIMLMYCGQIFLSKRVQRMPRLKPLVVALCVIQRSLWILLGVGVILLAKHYTGLFLVLFYIMYGILGLSEAFIDITWINYIVRIIHPGVRGRFLGIRQAITEVFMMLGALLYGLIIKQWELPLNFGLLLIISGCIQMIATPIMGATREPEAVEIQTDSEPKTRLNLSAIIDVLRGNKIFAFYLLAMVLVAGFGNMAFSFQVVFAKEKLAIAGEQNSYAMFFLLACQCAGALLCGVAGDRYGFRKLMVGAATLLLPTVLLTYLMSSFSMFYLSMGLVGLSQGITSVSGTNLLIQFGKGLKNMPIYLGIYNFILGPVLALNYIISGFLYDEFGYSQICILSALSLVAGIVFLCWNLLKNGAEKNRLPG
jgi:MFS family permease